MSTDPLANLPGSLTPDEARALINAKPGDTVKVQHLADAAMFLDSRSIFAVGIEHEPAVPASRVTADTSFGNAEEAPAVPGLPPGLDPAEAAALRAADAGHAVNVHNPEAAIEYVKAGYANPGVIVCNIQGFQFYPPPPVTERLATALTDPAPRHESVQARPRVKPAAI
jgi:hypothetical protein